MHIYMHTYVPTYVPSRYLFICPITSDLLRQYLSIAYKVHSAPTPSLTEEFM